MLTIAAFIFTLSVLIAIHEYGHFQVARWCGVKVLRFSIGFGRPLFRKTFGKDKTEFVLAALPFGGYVKMLDEREGPVDASEDLSRAFNRQSVWKRIAIVSAGPAANLLLAVFLYWVLFMHGVMGMKPLLGEIPVDSPAAQAGMKPGQLIQKVAGTATFTWQDVRWALLQESLESEVIEIEALGQPNNLQLHHLSLSSIGRDDYETDFLGKLGLKPYQPVVPAIIGEMIKSGAAARSGLQNGDEIIAVNSEAVRDWEHFVTIVRQHPQQELQLKLQREGRMVNLLITPDRAREEGGEIGRIGAMNRMDDALLDEVLVNVRYGPLESFAKASAKTWDTSIFSLKMLASMITGDVSWKGVSGPVTIASYAGQSAHIGWKAFIGFLALISISLGVLNLLPVPVLDGGHLMYYMVEIFKGSPVSEAVMEAGQRVGLFLLGLLMVLAFYNDINRFFTG
ncbi:MAG: RIP metalloprotease RseP [Betaproteobacteria bacterium HGW-Betaproteobacteria-1]|jgi:regulator of sigma E protease|nr:MAG: RIP metalloprotease RseP [Betaproteobacteria bacterium HGW-Betaproteobacteria-1]